ncbi:MAG: redoxin domain-containing protein [Bacteriovorax sp.]|nr:redoxin domain-containing protein [Bacteriovorax sp.]
MNKAPDFRLRMQAGTEFHLYSAIKNGPVVLNFIMGTWCPLCTAHIKRVRDWQQAKGL